MQILIGTTNPAKVGYFEKLLADTDAAFLTPHDLGVVDEPQETGNTPEENARIKAAFYGQYADAVICADSGLYFDALPLDDPRQPGLHIRTPNGRRLDDEQMIAHYAALAHSLGGKVMAYYLDGCAVFCSGQVYGFQATREEACARAFYLTDTPCAERKEGWPLDSLSLDLEEVSFLDAQRLTAEQLERQYVKRLKAFLRASLGI
ncbi:MAG: non-canonical purine NTP pyrophosphatase [Candidatus Ventricola sp.]